MVSQKKKGADIGPHKGKTWSCSPSPDILNPAVLTRGKCTAVSGHIPEKDLRAVLGA